MALTTDVILTLNEVIDLIIDGSEDYNLTGLQSHLDGIFPYKEIEVTSVRPNYLLPGQTDTQRPLEHPYVVIQETIELNQKLYAKDTPSANSNIRAYTANFIIRIEIWGKTLPEARDITEAVESLLRMMCPLLWSATRIKLMVKGTTDIPMEKEFIDIYRKDVTCDLSIFRRMEV